MNLVKCFMNPPTVHLIIQVTLQKPLTTTDAVMTRMPLLTLQTQIDLKACTLEKNVVNIKTVRNLPALLKIREQTVQTKNRDRKNMVAISALHTVSNLPALLKIREQTVQTKNRDRKNMVAISALHTVSCNKQSSIERNDTSVGNARDASVPPQTSLYIREFILVRNPTSATFVTNPLPSVQLLKHTNVFILERNLTNAKNVENHFLSCQHLKAIRKCILGRSLTNVRSVTDSLPTVPVSGDIRKLIELRNILAQIVVKTCISFHTLKAITDSILERTRTNAVSVTDPFPTMNYLEFIKKLILQK